MSLVGCVYANRNPRLNQRAKQRGIAFVYTGRSHGALTQSQHTTASKTISIQIAEERLALIDRAARLRGQNRTEFLIESAHAAAIAEMAERSQVLLDDTAYEELVAALAAPASPSDRLRTLLAEPSPWN